MPPGLNIDSLLASARNALSKEWKEPPENASPQPIEAGHVIFFALGDGASRATVIAARGPSIDIAWQQGAVALQARAKRATLPPKCLRVEVVDKVEPLTWGALKARLAQTKRNYFNLSIAFDAHFKHAMLAQEMQGAAVLYSGEVEHALPNLANLRLHAKRRFGTEIDFPSDDAAPVWCFTTRAVYVDAQGAWPITAEGQAAGFRRLDDWNARQVRTLIDSASDYLAEQVKPTGEFHYGWFPCFDRAIPTYNTLRHASTTYAMLEAWELTRSATQKAAIDRSLGILTQKLIRQVPLPDGAQAALLVDVGNEVKLGGNAVCLLALVKYTELTGDRQYMTLMEQLALGIRAMQDTKTGRFVHVLNFPKLDIKDAFRVIYYDGEAAFGLMRLYGLTRDERWLAVVEKAFDHFIAAKHWQAHDHWLSYCVNELTRYRPETRYYQFGLQNVAGYLDFVLERITTFPTLLELMMAAREMVLRIDADPALRPLLDGLDREKFDRALEHRARYLANGHFWPELAMFFRNPDRIAGSFFIKHHSFRVRIDDVEHYLSGYVAYHRLLKEREALAVPAALSDDVPYVVHVVDRRTEPANLPQGDERWNAANVLAATGGEWLRAPSSSRWRATGLCTWPVAMQAGHMVAVRSPGGTKGAERASLARLPFQPQALITDGSLEGLPAGVPVLRVADLGGAILALGAYARNQMTGRLVGVTGSAGKTTTVAMLSHVLRPWGEIGQTGQNANLPHGIAWNLSSVPWNAPFTVIEMAIGRMRESARMVRPDIAIVTTITAAHLEYHDSVEEVARRKARIFTGMQPGGLAVLNRDLAQWSIFAEEAQRHALRIVNYGKHPEADVRLIEYETSGRSVHARIGERDIRYALGAPGEHMALNSLACVAAIEGLGLSLDVALPMFSLFKPVAGRGSMSDLRIGDKLLRVLDEAYNANPASMTAALNLIRDVEPPIANGRRVLILGDMLELGPQSADLHAALSGSVQQAAPDLVLLCGNEMASLREQLRGTLPLHWFPNVEHLKEKLPKLLAHGDLALVKGSGGTRLSELVDMLKGGAVALASWLLVVSPVFQEVLG
ncbi:UDP-N-acetylmuramoyl-tripeptide--D-alanyl-D-alanine ligase [Variovorax boronicumulans]|uniref:UDP-N-acetylmuramoyl-tripeptide--D-alanyl-D- alanine ligase n=1 Tax=Variovorax boronicumulans TaxID=436515 RepID=UPI002789C9C4|nr:UDP-N-acetylmuramoyl-tripeptide--D-alanyl-D-alanine ligase [Variovorax boronicumulans]MDQ0041709.1 UDP-N-acetylmuramoyl-tripeptide--D-alanyl-D-alanine ligase [Variovorax boronicumulans]